MIITVSHQKGGVGKSTICWNMAGYLQKKKIDFIIIDLDVQQTLTGLNKIRKKYNPKKSFEIKTFDDKKNLVDFLNNVQDEDIVLIDSGGFDSTFNRISIMASDKIVTPVSSHFIEVLGLQKYEEILKEVSKVIDRQITTNVVLNKIKPNQKDFKELKKFINKSGHYKIMDSILRDRVEISTIISTGATIIESKKKETKAKDEFVLFCKEIFKY
ncbi:MAG: ParA family protein [Arcobacteraceae bacterium]|nr:ParA family protein [Arcobacteraceae bacterium]